MLMLASIVLVPSCKSGKNKSGEKVQNDEKTLFELVQDVTEAPKMGIWKVDGRYRDVIPTLEAERVREKDGKKTCWFTTYFTNTLCFYVKLWGEFSYMEEDKYACELHLKSSNQEELIVHGGTDWTQRDPHFSAETSKQIIRYMSTATSPVTLSFVGVPKDMTFEIPTEGFKEVCKCWYNALIEKGYERVLK